MILIALVFVKNKTELNRWKYQSMNNYAANVKLEDNSQYSGYRVLYSR